jgi:hypothetical protein
MNKTILSLTFFSFVACVTLSAQTVVASSGGHFENGTAQMSFTLGETVTPTIANDSNTLTQGFHQTKLTVVGLEELLESIGMLVFPNPTSDFITIELNDDPTNYEVIMLDATGKLVSSSPVRNKTEQIDMRHLAAGSYYLNIINKENLQNRNSYQIVKTH